MNHNEQEPLKWISATRARTSVSEGIKIAHGLDTASTASIPLALLDSHDFEYKMYSTGYHKGLSKDRRKRL